VIVERNSIPPIKTEILQSRGNKMVGDANIVADTA
jgi:hypothetical protein